MKIIASTGREDIAVVYLAEFDQGQYVEFVQAVQPPTPRQDKWILLVSTLYGCPVQCEMCDAGGFYHGKVSKERIFDQIDFLVRKHYPDRVIPCRQFKIQFARMGEPAFNIDVIRVLEEFSTRYDAPGFMPSISTIAPHGTDLFFQELVEVKNAFYNHGNFQFQFSLHTTDQNLRDKIIPVKKWDFAQMKEYGERFYQPGDRKITLNFALAEDYPIDPIMLLKYFDPAKFLIKITPLNPTYSAKDNNLSSYIDPDTSSEDDQLIQELRSNGYDVILSIGEVEENLIGSNCGQFVRKHIQTKEKLEKGYLYSIDS
jgi:23S rRNA (adenine2503-C2)-methyltransferase